MRWARDQVLFEPAGKDHHSHGGSFDTANLVSTRVYDWPAPVSFSYDFIGTKGLPGKMSSSSGNVVDLRSVLAVYQPEVTRYLFAGTRPNTEFSISFDLDVIKTYEDYDKTERIAWGVEKAKNDEVFQREKRIYELSQIGGMPPAMPYQVPFRHLCNLLQINSGDIDAVLAFLGDVSPEQEATFRARAKCAWYWIAECAPDGLRYVLGEKADLDSTEKAAVAKLAQNVVPRMDSLSEKELGQALYDLAAELNMDPKALFAASYKALIGKDQGPRLANFLLCIGRERLERILA
jgi:lysyl-tRNA synthetase class 1